MSETFDGIFKDRYPKSQQLFYHLGRPYVKTSADNNSSQNFGQNLSQNFAQNSSQNSIQSRIFQNYQNSWAENSKTDQFPVSNSEKFHKAEPPEFVPDFVKLDKKTLCWDSYFEDPVFFNEKELHHIRLVKIYFHLSDNSWSIFEPEVTNSGLEQGRIFHKQKIQKSDGKFLHWSEINLGTEVEIFGRKYHVCDCDQWTKEFLSTNGIILNDPEPLPKDPALTGLNGSKGLKGLKVGETQQKEILRPKGAWNQFLEFQGKRLKFLAVWDEKLGDAYYNRKIRRFFEISYFLEDDTVQIKETEKSRDNLLTPIWLKRQLLPKPEGVEHYTAKDFTLGAFINVYSREMFVYDCDSYTREFFQKVFNIFFPVAAEIPNDLMPLNPSHHFQNKELFLNFDLEKNEVKVVEKKPSTVLNRDWVQGRIFFDWAPIAEAMIEPKNMKELKLGNAVTLYKWKFQLVDWDPRTLRFFQELKD